MGHLFILPFYLGFLFFFLRPVLQSLIYTFQRVSFSTEGIVQEFVGLKNIRFVLWEDTYYTTNLVTGTLEMIPKMLLILLCSLVFALLLNQKFHGRFFVRVVFFLPVIIATGLAMDIVKGDLVAGSVMTGASVSGGDISQSMGLHNLLISSGLSESVVETVTGISDSIFDTIWKTGIQTVIFLAGLQSIPRTLYEASWVEGASAWEGFWKITLPMLMPIILVNLVYTVIDSFTDSSNAVMQQIMKASGSAQYGEASAMAWIYFLSISAVLGILVLIFSRISRSTR